MRRMLLPILALLAGISLCGCNSHDDSPAETASPKGTAAIVDLDAVARRLGRDVEMVGAVKSRAGALNEQLKAVQVQYEQELTEQKEQFGEERTAEETEKLLNMQSTANLQINQLRQQAQANLSQHQQALVQQYRDQVRPIAQKVAEEKGLSIVFTKIDTIVFSYESAVDITDEVADRMSKLPRTPAARTASKASGSIE